MTARTRSRELGRLASLGVLLLLTPPMAVVGRFWGRDWALRAWCRWAARAVGLSLSNRGPEPPPGCLVAANHVGYLDIVALGGSVTGRFVAKSEIAGWPLLGLIARWGGTAFIDRERLRRSRSFLDEVAQMLEEGERILLFPEGGVSPDGVTLRAFHPMLFEACVRTGRPVVPAVLRYVEPADPGAWAWIEEPSLWRHLRSRVLRQRRIAVEVRFGEPLWPAHGEDRKALAERARLALIRLKLDPPPRCPRGPPTPETP